MADMSAKRKAVRMAEWLVELTADKLANVKAGHLAKLTAVSWDAHLADWKVALSAASWAVGMEPYLVVRTETSLAALLAQWWAAMKENMLADLSVTNSAGPWAALTAEQSADWKVLHWAAKREMSSVAK